MTRDYTALYGPDGCCRICAAPAHGEPAEFHAARHLEDGTAYVDLHYRGHEPTYYTNAQGQRCLGWPTVRELVRPVSDAPVVAHAHPWEADSDGSPVLTGPVADNLRAALLKGRELNRQTRRKIAAAKKGRAA